MAYHQDWLMRQIEAISATLAYILTGKKAHAATIDEEQQRQTGGNALAEKLLAIVSAGEICQGENLLYEAMEQNNPEAADAALLFYSAINQLSDQELLACNFSRDEIKEGLEAVCTKYGLNIF